MEGRIFHHNTLGTLMTGSFEGSMTVGEILSHGSIGIGTLDGIDGELVILDRVAYQLKVDGSCRLVNADELSPYAAVTDFNPEQSLRSTTQLSKEEFENIIKEQFSSKNVFQSVKVHGTFKMMHCRSVEKQEKPYPKLVEAARAQTEFTRENVEGTLVGFYTPTLFGSISATSFHLHFISDEKDFGGHVLDFVFEKGLIQFQTVETVEQHFPTNNVSFMHADLDYENVLEEIEEAE